MAEDAPENVAEPDEAPQEEEVASPPALFTSKAALSLEEAATIVGRRGATVVLLMGEIGAGKTTLLVELWAVFLLRGTIGGHRLAGSRTALALEERAYHSRVESKLESGTTRRTHETEDGFVHMRVQRPDESLREVLFADVSGEHFSRVRQGRPLLEELPWVTRTDRFVVVIDGAKYAALGEREVMLNAARRQLFALQNSGAVDQRARVAVCIVKTDQMSDDDEQSFISDSGSLLEEARKIDDSAVCLAIAARPADGSAAVGLDSFLAWLCGDDRIPKRAPPVVDAPLRAISRFRT